MDSLSSTNLACFCFLEYKIENKEMAKKLVAQSRSSSSYITIFHQSLPQIPQSFSFSFSTPYSHLYSFLLLLLLFFFIIYIFIYFLTLPILLSNYLPSPPLLFFWTNGGDASPSHYLICRRSQGLESFITSFHQ